MSEGRISNSSAVISTLVSTLGSGITLMPAFFNKFGTRNSLLIMMFIGLITFISLYSLAFSADATKSDSKTDSFSYDGIAASFSRTLKRCVAIALVISSLATTFSSVQTLTKLVMQSLNFSETFSNTINTDEKDSMPYILLKLAFLVFISLIYFPLFKRDNLSSLQFFSKLSLFCAILFSVVTVGYGVLAPYDFNNISDAERDIKKCSVGDALGFVIFALHCQFSFPSILASMKDQSLSNFRNNTLISSILATALYSIVGMFGYIAFGNAIGKESIILSFGVQESGLAKSLKSRFGETFGVLVPRAIHVAYIPIFFSGIIFNVFSIVPILGSFLSFGGKPASRNFIASVLTLFIILSGVFNIESLGAITGVIGFACVTPLSFLFPALFVVFSSKRMSLFKVVSYAMIVLSLAIMFGLCFAMFIPSKSN